MRTAAFPTHPPFPRTPAHLSRNWDRVTEPRNEDTAGMCVLCTGTLDNIWSEGKLCLLQRGDFLSAATSFSSPPQVNQTKGHLSPINWLDNAFYRIDLDPVSFSKLMACIILQFVWLPTLSLMLQSYRGLPCQWGPVAAECQHADTTSETKCSLIRGLRQTD